VTDRHTFLAWVLTLIMAPITLGAFAVVLLYRHEKEWVYGLALVAFIVSLVLALAVVGLTVASIREERRR